MPRKNGKSQTFERIGTKQKKLPIAVFNNLF